MQFFTNHPTITVIAYACMVLVGVNLFTYGCVLIAIWFLPDTEIELDEHEKY